MDYYKNVDRLCNGYGNGYTNPLTAKGIQYREVTDVPTEPVDLEFFKEHARIDFDTDDTLAEAYIKAARRELEAWAQLSFGVKTMRLMAVELPDEYRLMYGKVDEVLTTGFENFGDIILKGGTKVDITYTTLDWIGEDIKIAICRYAAGLYVYREQLVDTKYNAQVGIDEAKNMVKPYANLTLI